MLKSGLTLFFLLAVMTSCAMCRYPIMVYGTNLGKQDLFLDENQLVERLLEQNSKLIQIFNIQTQIEEQDLLINRIRSKSEYMRLFKQLLQNAFISQYINYDSYNITHKLQEKEGLTTRAMQINLLNFRNVEEHLQEIHKRNDLKDSIIIVTFQHINSNVKILQEIPDSANLLETESLTTTQTETETEGDDTSDNDVANMSSSNLAGYLIFIALIFTLWIGTSCLMDIKTPERFVKTNFYYGKEN